MAIPCAFAWRLVAGRSKKLIAQTNSCRECGPNLFPNVVVDPRHIICLELVWYLVAVIPLVVLDAVQPVVARSRNDCFHRSCATDPVARPACSRTANRLR